MPFTYAIADLHGRYDLLSEAVTKIVEHSKSDRSATIITLGDYVDRGPKSRPRTRLAIFRVRLNGEHPQPTLGPARTASPRFGTIDGGRKHANLSSAIRLFVSQPMCMPLRRSAPHLGCDRKATLRRFLASAPNAPQFSPTSSSTTIHGHRRRHEQQMSNGGCHA